MFHCAIQRRHYWVLGMVVGLLGVGLGLGSATSSAQDGGRNEQIHEVLVVPLLTEHVQKRVIADSAGTEFGTAVSVATDIAVVGAHKDDPDGVTDAGAAFVYGRSRGGANNWGQITKLVAGDSDAGDEFGRAVHLSLGVTLTVGAPGDDEQADNAGAAYVFLRDPNNGNLWPQVAKLTAADGAAGDGFGMAVAGHQRTVVVGAPGDNDNGPLSGSAYIFVRNSATPPEWIQVKKLTAPGGAAGDRFGEAVFVSYSGDLVVVGAPGADDACIGNSDCDSGAIYLFERDNGGPNQWGLRAKRLASDTEAGDLFGSALSMNYSEDRLMVGAPGDDDNGNNAGSAYVFERKLASSNTSWTEMAKVSAADGSANSRFGASLGIGANIAIVGAPFALHDGSNRGAAYLFFRHASSRQRWTEVSKIVASDGGAGYRFGAAVDIQSGDIVVGAPLNPSAGADAGAAYFYQTPFDVGTLQIATNVEPDAPDSNWDISAGGPLVFGETLGGDNLTDPIPLFAGNYSITQSPGANTNAALYDTTWTCMIDGSLGPAGSGASLQVVVGIRQNVVCNFLNVRPGSIIIEKQTEPEGGTGFGFTDTIQAPNNFTLDDNGTKTFVDLNPGTYQVTENEQPDWRLTSVVCIDPDNGSTIAGTTATIDLDAGESIRCTFVSREKDGISIVKTAGVSVASVGQTITYTYRVFNDGPDTLTDIIAIDDKLGEVPLEMDTLASGEDTSGTLAYTVMADDLPGPLVNTVVVTGTPPAAPPLTDNAMALVNLTGLPAIEIQITASKSAAGVDELITYVYQVTNNGPTDLRDVTVVDSRLGNVPLIDTTLGIGGSTTGTLNYQVLVGDLPGPLVNNVTAMGVSPSNLEASATDSVVVELSVEAGIGITLTATPQRAAIGQVIQYTYEVVNEGEIPLSNVSVVDDRLGEIDLDVDSLAPGQVTTATLEYTVSESDWPGPLVNTATASGTPPVGSTVTGQSSVSVSLDESDLYLPRVHQK